MNASAPALTREDEVQSRIRHVRTFSRGARVVCSALFGFGLVGSAGVLLIGVLSLFLPMPVNPAGFTAGQKLWGLPMFGAVMGCWLAIVYQLYRLFGDLAAGSIYTPENVRRVRRVGVLYLALAVLGVLIPLVWAVLVRVGAMEPSMPAVMSGWLSSSEPVGSFFTAGLILLISWVMDVGLYEKDHAEALQRDAELVI